MVSSIMASIGAPKWTRIGGLTTRRDNLKVSSYLFTNKQATSRQFATACVSLSITNLQTLRYLQYSMNSIEKESNGASNKHEDTDSPTAIYSDDQLTTIVEAVLGSMDLDKDGYINWAEYVYSNKHGQK